MIIKIGNRVIGIADPVNRIFIKKVKLSKHLFKKFDAFGVDATYFTDVLLPMEYDIRIYEKEEGFRYSINAVDWKKNAQYFHFKDEDEDHQAQIFLSRRFFKKYKI